MRVINSKKKSSGNSKFLSEFACQKSAADTKKSKKMHDFWVKKVRKVANKSKLRVSKNVKNKKKILRELAQYHVSIVIAADVSRRKTFIRLKS